MTKKAKMMYLSSWKDVRMCHVRYVVSIGEWREEGEEVGRETVRAELS